MTIRQNRPSTQKHPHDKGAQKFIKGKVIRTSGAQAKKREQRKKIEIGAFKQGI